MTLLDSTVDDFVAGVRAGDRVILSRAVTLIESQSLSDEKKAQKVLQELLPHSGKAKRIGITGAPGVGKSTFIEAFGCYLIDQGHAVAVLAIDPSSKLSGGSILGDKTRMENLSRQSRAFIRPSPSGDSMGGVARRTRETILLCEAAGFDPILVESVGVGQSEVALRSIVDFLLLLLLPGAGDELQGIKRGIIEMADDVLINKADGENLPRAEHARLEQQASLSFLQPATPGWKAQAALCSARTGEGIPQAWQRMEQFFRQLEPQGLIAKRRQQQAVDWLADLIRAELQRRFDQHPRVQARLPALRSALLRGEITAVSAARDLFAEFDGGAEKLNYDHKN
jgi:LAO/AO transport system kinase